jgi:uncharacterized membrane protein YfcA
MALIFIGVINVGLETLITAIVCQVVGAYITPRIVVKLPIKIIKGFIGCGLLVATCVILANKLGFMPSGGASESLFGAKLIVMGIACFIWGGLNNIGIGSYALTMATVYALGMSPAVAFPIMMGAATFSVPVGSMQFIKYNCYSRKIVFFCATVGVVGVLLAVYVIKSLNIATLQWVVAAVILYSGISMLLSLRKNEEEMTIPTEKAE